MTKGMSWPVVLMVFTPEMPATSIVLSMNRIKEAIVPKVSTCATVDRQWSSILGGVSETMQHEQEHHALLRLSDNFAARNSSRFNPAAEQRHKSLE